MYYAHNTWNRKMEGLSRLSKLIRTAKENRETTSDTAPPAASSAFECIEEQPVKVAVHKRVDKKEKKQSNNKINQSQPPNSKATRREDSRDERTIFVGNVPMSLSKKKVIKMFTVHGKVESARMRCAAVTPGKLPVKVARKLKKQLAGGVVNWYVVMTTVDEAKQCLELNGTEIDGRHLRIDMATPTNDNRRTVFIGNLPFSADEEKLRELLGHCGEIEGVRIVKDGNTGIGKGIAFVLFKESSGVLFAVKHNSRLELDGRKLRISRCQSGGKGEGPKKDKTHSRYGTLKVKGHTDKRHKRDRPHPPRKPNSFRQRSRK